MSARDYCPKCGAMYALRGCICPIRNLTPEENQEEINEAAERLGLFNREKRLRELEEENAMLKKVVAAMTREKK